MTIHETLTLVENVVLDALNGANGQTATPPDGPGDSGEDDIFDDFDLEATDSYDAFDEDDFHLGPSDSTALRRKLRRDLRAVKNAGYKVGYLGHVEGCIILSIASRIARLGISDEAMKAWSVCSADYLVLLIRYNRAYQTLQELSELGDMANTFVQMRVGLCDSYKPSFDAAVEAFQGKDTSAAEKKVLAPSLRNLFIGAQLDKLLNERFLGIVKHRLQYGFSWTGAELFFHVSQGKQLGPDDASAPEYLEPDSWATPPPAYLVSDHMVDTGLAMPNISLPLLAMQYLLRHFVRCTEFCLVCHCRKHDDYEALRPYVCSDGLCFYQYITFGMGPSLEYEILFQPYVVDLLVSLAYARAQSGHLEDFPKGLGLQVPHTGNPEHGDELDRSRSKRPKISEFHEATLDYAKMELSGLDASRLKVGDWVRIFFSDFNPNNNQSGSREWHCRIQHLGETSNHIGIALPVRGGRQLTAEDIHGLHKGDLKQVEVKCAPYNKNFDDLPPDAKRRSIIMLLNTLPDIETMTDYLKNSGPEKKLSSWRDRISPGALDLLRWIVASNRSCILQDSCDREHLVSGMQNYLQFRLVQGAPDKEQRFLRAIDKHTMSNKSQHPTLFAWHGSPVHNWHSILREGLHYKQVVHGRALGDGVYMSRHFSTSSNYSQNRTSTAYWPQSKLVVRSVISLNEVVNATEMFVHKGSDYVVKQLDWIQPRYLFVGTSRTGANATNVTMPVASGENISFSQTSLPKVGGSASVIYKQDPSFPVHGPDDKHIKIPISAFSSKRRSFLSSAEPADVKKEKANGKKKRAILKKTSSILKAPSSQSEECKNSFGDGDPDETASVMTTIEDLNILLSDSEGEVSGSPSKKPNSADRASKTDFMPGTMKEDNLPLLSPPQYATSRATMALQKHLQATLKVQEKEHLHELGWFVDSSLIKTVYQWIVELHTFDKDLPLAQDLKKAKLQSVVLELRFPPEFPMDPPFVRVIRPRFLEFQAGGGGHVTLGGAMCMELLTNSGWSAATSIESLLLQVRLAISSTDPRPGRLAHYGRDQDYHIGEAIASYKRACLAHGWAIPKDMERISW